MFPLGQVEFAVSEELVGEMSTEAEFRLGSWNCK